QYGIKRSSTGTAAVCQALLDSTAGSTTACKFEFSFVLGAVYSPIDLANLANDVSASAAASNCTVVLPWQLDSSRPVSLSSPYVSSISYQPGSQLRTFALSIEITDAASNSPAVANANLFIKQLTASIEPFLLGQFAIKLDDSYPDPIEVTAVLNF